MEGMIPRYYKCDLKAIIERIVLHHPRRLRKGKAVRKWLVLHRLGRLKKSMKRSVKRHHRHRLVPASRKKRKTPVGEGQQKEKEEKKENTRCKGRSPTQTHSQTSQAMKAPVPTTTKTSTPLSMGWMSLLSMEPDSQSATPSDNIMEVVDVEYTLV